MRSFFEFEPCDLQAFCRDHDLPRYVADQLLDWVYRKGVTDPQAMTNISQAQREAIAAALGFCRGSVAAH